MSPDPKRGLRELEQYRRKLEMLRASKGFNVHETQEEQRERINAAKADLVAFAETYLPHYRSSHCVLRAHNPAHAALLGLHR